MSRQSWLWILAVAADTLIVAGPSAVMAAPAAAGGTVSNQKVETTGVYRYVSGQDSGNCGGMSFETLVWAPAGGGAPFKVMGPRGFMATLTAGKLYEIKMEKTAAPGVSTPPLIHEHPKEYTVKAGEDLPGVYLFQNVVDEDVGGQKRTGIEVSKFAQTIKLWLPNVKDDSRQNVPDPKLLGKAKALKKDDPVKVEFTPGQVPTVRSLAAYAPPRDGEFVEATTVEVGDQELAAATVKIGSETVTAAIAKGSGDAKLASLLKRLKAGQAVTISLHKEGDQAWLDDIKVADKKAEPAAKKPA